MRAQSLLVLAVLLATVSAGQTASSAASETNAIGELQKKLSAGKSTALDDFWSSISTHHSPIIEVDPADANYSFVTFVWQGEQATRNVVVVSPLALVNFDDAAMLQLSGTNVWYKTYRMRNDARLTYRFAVNDSLVPFEKETRFFERMRSWKADQHNPRTFNVGGDIVASVLELPDAPSDKWTKLSQSSPKGTISEFSFESDMLHNQRSIWIYKPPNFEAGKSYPLLLIMDGESYTSLIPMPAILDNLIASKAILPVAAVLIGSGPGDARDKEMNCNRLWGQVLVKELLPWLRDKQDLRFADKDIVIVGDSLTGLAAACAAHDFPATFSKVITQSGSYYRAPVDEEPEWLARHIAAEPPLPLRFHIEIGLLETAPIPNRDPSMLTANRHLRDVLLAKGNRVKYVEHFSGHEHLSWRATIGDALIEMLNPE
jgi:enterochelin esterase-like enzyme